MKRKIYIMCFIALALLLALSALLLVPSAEEKKIKDSEALTTEMGSVVKLDGSLVSIYAYHGKEAYEKNLFPVLTLANECDLPVFFAIPPRKMDVFEKSLPEALSASSLFSLTEKKCRDTLTYIDLYHALSGRGELYFNTDHHWRGEGAYLAYREIATALGATPLDITAFPAFTAAEEYLGSDYNKLGDDGCGVTDSLVLYESAVPLRITQVSHPYDSEENNLTLDSIYKMECLGYPDKYTVFFGGNAPYITVRGEGERETLLMVRDSFASALVPFLSAHFDLVLLDTRFFPGRVRDVVSYEGADKILVLQNMGTLTENTLKIIY